MRSACATHCGTVVPVQVMLHKRRYEIGLDKLQTTESSVSGMKEELIALQPQLEVRGCTLQLVQAWLCKRGVPAPDSFMLAAST